MKRVFLMLFVFFAILTNANANEYGKGMASVTLETDNSDTTLIRNPNYNKYNEDYVGANGYGRIDDRKYIEVPNQNKGGKVPLLEAIGIPKKGPAEGTYEKMIADIKNDPSNWNRVTGGLKKDAQMRIQELNEAKLAAGTDDGTYEEMVADIKNDPSNWNRATGGLKPDAQKQIQELTEAKLAAGTKGTFKKSVSKDMEDEMRAKQAEMRATQAVQNAQIQHQNAEIIRIQTQQRQQDLYRQMYRP